MTDVTIKQRRLSIAEYLKKYPETTQPMELLNGEVIMSPAPTDEHAEISMNLSMLLSFFIKSNKLGMVRAAPSDLHLDEVNVVQPDIFFIAKDNPNCKKVNHYWHGAPDLCIEILSPSTAKQDRGAKYDLYEQHGVREYWIVDPQMRVIEVYALNDKRRYERVGVYDEKDTLQTALLPNLKIPVEQIMSEKEDQN